MNSNSLVAGDGTPLGNFTRKTSTMPSRAVRPLDNRLLAALPAASFANIEPHLELGEMALGKVLHESGAQVKCVCFPVTAIVSLLYVLENGASAEMALIGNDGMVGIASVLGGGSMHTRAVVQSAGSCFRMPVAQFQKEFERDEALMHIVLRYTQSLIAQLGQTAVCNRHHSIDQQLCRWLLMSRDRLQSDQLFMTQELIANMLGVRREGVTEAAGKLHALGAIRYRRGHITIVDRPMLERMVCECYAALERETTRLVGRPVVSQPTLDLPQSSLPGARLSGSNGTRYPVALDLPS